MCQDELALRVKQLKTELVLFKGLVSNVSGATSFAQLIYFALQSADKVAPFFPSGPVRSGQQDPGEGHEGGHGHLPPHRHHSSSLRCGPAEELRGPDSDVPGTSSSLPRPGCFTQETLRKQTRPLPTGGHTPLHPDRPQEKDERAVGQRRRCGRTERVGERGRRSQGRGAVRHVCQSDQRADAEDAESTVCLLTVCHPQGAFERQV